MRSRTEVGRRRILISRKYCLCDPPVLSGGNGRRWRLRRVDGRSYGFCYAIASRVSNQIPLATLLAETESGGQPDVKNERDYAILKRRIQDAGLLDKNPGYYVLSITTNLVVWTFCLVLVFTVGAVWAQALAAVALGLVSVQLGFQLHDSGHRQMFALVAVHVVAYLGAMVYFLGPWSALMVVLIQKGVGGVYMAAVFAPNHKGMPQTDSDSRMDFLRTQVLTARNVRGHPLTDLWYGSLNYQIEHHLFPGMPRLHMRRAQPIIPQFCRQPGIEYYETSVLDSYPAPLRFLDAICPPLPARRVPV